MVPCRLRGFFRARACTDCQGREHPATRGSRNVIERSTCTELDALRQERIAWPPLGSLAETTGAVGNSGRQRSREVLGAKSTIR
jgi:hypothetical protein